MTGPPAAALPGCSEPGPSRGSAVTVSVTRPKVPGPGRDTAAGLTRRRWLRPVKVPGSDGPDVLGLVALAAGTDLELDLLAFLEVPVTGAGDLGEVDEDVA